MQDEKVKNEGQSLEAEIVSRPGADPSVVPAPESPADEALTPGQAGQTVVEPDNELDPSAIECVDGNGPPPVPDDPAAKLEESASKRKRMTIPRLRDRIKAGEFVVAQIEVPEEMLADHPIPTDLDPASDEYRLRVEARRMAASAAFHKIAEETGRSAADIFNEQSAKEAVLYEALMEAMRITDKEAFAALDPVVNERIKAPPTESIEAGVRWLAAWVTTLGAFSHITAVNETFRMSFMRDLVAPAEPGKMAVDVAIHMDMAYAGPDEVDQVVESIKVMSTAKHTLDNWMKQTIKQYEKPLMLRGVLKPANPGGGPGRVPARKVM